jgi:hypothetical protein
MKNQLKKVGETLCFCLVLLALFITSTITAVPNTISYQGKLTDSSGVPVNASVSIQFIIYDSAAAGTSLWSETKSVVVTSGHFSTDLGSTSALSTSIFETEPVYLALKVGADSEMTPRIKLQTAPYAFKADKADSVANGSITNASITANAAIDTSKLGSAVMVEGENISLLTNNAGYITSASTISGLVRSTQSGNSYITGGYLGVGTTTPVELISVSDGNGMSGSSAISFNERGMFGYDGSIPAASVMGGTSKSIVFKTNGNNERVRISSDGYVGIGLTNPEAILHVKRSTYPVSILERTTSSTLGVKVVNRFLAKSSGNMVDTFGPVNYYSIEDSAGVVNNIAYSGAIRDGADDSGKYVIYTANSGTSELKLAIDKYGRVGMGTSEPSDYLHVSGSGVKRVHVQSTDSDAALKASSDTGSYSWYADGQTNNFRVYDYTAGTDRMTMDGSGNLGIGTTTPTEKLDVVGTVNATSFVGDGSGLTGVDAGKWDGSTDIYYTDGNVGIGTTTPSTALDVVGTVNATTFSGSGARLTSLPAAQLTGTVANARLDTDLQDLADGTLSASKVENGSYLISSAGTNGQVWTSDGTGPGAWSASSGLWDTATGGINYSNGNVSIGTPTASSQLTLGVWKNGYAGANGDTQLLISGLHNSGANSDGGIKLKIEGYDNDGGAIYPIYCRDENETVDFWIRNRISGSDPLMYFAGKVGVGKTNPTTELDVVGTVKATSFVGDGSTLTGLASGKWSGSTDIYYTSGNVGIGISTPAEALSVIGNIIATGSLGSGDTISASGAGTRLMWYPKKAAFRSGSIDGTQWDDSNIGTNSVAMGADTKASGTWSIAIGDETTASGIGSFAAGRRTVSSKEASVAMGYQTTASGAMSTSLGLYTLASGSASTAMGYYAGAQSYASVALGRYNVISGTTTSWVDTDPLFVIGNGADSSNRANAVTVLKNGNVGIGTTTPTEKIDVVGTVNATAFVGDGSGLTGVDAGQWSSATGGINYSGDNVGINNSSPSDKLHVSGGHIRVDGNQQVRFGSADRFIRYDEGDATFTFASPAHMTFILDSNSGSQSTGDFIVKRNTTENSTATELFRVTTAGDVGIGTSVMDADLHVVGSSTLGRVLIAPNESSSEDDSEIMLAEDKDGTFGMKWLYDGGLNKLFLYGENNGVLKGPHMTVYRDTTNIGIGTTTPSSELQVDGEIYANGPVIYKQNTSTIITTGQTVNVDWSSSSIYKISTQHPVTVTFGTAPNGPSKLILIISYDGSYSSSTAQTLPSCNWQGGTAPTLIGQANRTDIVSFVYDGSEYYGAVSADFY